MLVKNIYPAIIKLKQLHANWKSLHWGCVPRLLIISEANKSNRISNKGALNSTTACEKYKLKLLLREGLHFKIENKYFFYEKYCKDVWQYKTISNLFSI